MTVGEVVEISASLNPKHAARNAAGKRGKIVKLNRTFESATVELLDSGERYTLSTLYLERVSTPEITYLSPHVGYATLDGKLHAWIGFKTKDLYKAWCCRSRSHSPRIRGLGEARRSTHLLQHKWECPIKKPTLTQLQVLAQNDFSRTPPVAYTTENLPQKPPSIRPILEPGTPVEVTVNRHDSDLARLNGEVGTVLVDYLKHGVLNGIIVKLGENHEYLMGNEFRVVRDENSLPLAV